MSCLSVSYQNIDCEIAVSVYNEPTLSVELENEFSDLTVEGMTDAGITCDYLSEYGVLTATCDFSLMEAEAYNESCLTASVSTLLDLSVEADNLSSIEVEAHNEEGLSVEIMNEMPALMVEAHLVCDLSTTPYLDLSKYNLWVVPEYYENVDVYSNTEWIIN